MKAADLDTVVSLALPHLQAAGKVSQKPDAQEMAWIHKLVALYHDQISYGAEIVEASSLFFNDEVHLDASAKEIMQGETVPTVVESMREKLSQLSDEAFTSENINPLVKAVQKETGVKGKNLFMPIRIAVSGQMHGPQLADMIEVLGKKKALSHIDQIMSQR